VLFAASEKSSVQHNVLSIVSHSVGIIKAKRYFYLKLSITVSKYGG